MKVRFWMGMLLLLSGCGEINSGFDIHSGGLVDVGGNPVRDVVVGDPDAGLADTGAGDPDLGYVPDIQAPPDIDNSMKPSCPEPDGPWRLYFSKPVSDDAVCGEVSLDRAYAYWIGTAQTSLDLAVYSLDAKSVGDALIAAHERGVDLRVIVNNDSDRVQAVEAAGVPVLRDPSEDELMHHKFMIIDDAWVWFGSANATTQSGRADANNVLVAESSAFADALSTEFERLWAGGFHENKGGGTSFYLDGGRAELFFSPGYVIEDELEGLIAGADHEILVSMLAFTRQGLANALLDRCGEVEIAVLVDGDPSWERANLWGCDEMIYLEDNVPETAGFQYWPVLHHKLMLVDAGYAGSDPMIVTGSMNWSSNGITSNDESVLVWQHAEAAAQYRAEFLTRLEEAGGALQGK